MVAFAHAVPVLKLRQRAAVARLTLKEASVGVKQQRRASAVAGVTFSG